MVGTKVRIINKHGKDVEMNEIEIGEIIVKGKGIISDETTKTTKDGWVYTGDYGTIDYKGEINVVKSNTDIVTNDDKFSTIIIEDILANHPSVQEVSVIPEPHHLLGEIAHAFVVLNPEYIIVEIELVNYIKEKLSSNEKSIKLTFMSELPKTVSGKILKNQLS